MSDGFVRILDNVHVYELDGEMIVLNLNTEHYLSLSKSATQMLKTLQESQSVDQALSTLSEIYDIDISTLSSDLSSFIDELVRLDLIVMTADET